MKLLLRTGIHRAAVCNSALQLRKALVCDSLVDRRDRRTGCVLRTRCISRIHRIVGAGTVKIIADQLIPIIYELVKLRIQTFLSPGYRKRAKVRIGICLVCDIIILIFQNMAVINDFSAGLTVFMSIDIKDNISAIAASSRGVT